MYVCGSQIGFLLLGPTNSLLQKTDMSRSLTCFRLWIKLVQILGRLGSQT